MEETRFEERERVRATRRPRAEPRGKRDYMVRIIGVQAIVCVGLLALALLCWKLGGAQMETLRGMFEQYIGESTVREVRDVLADVKEFIFQPADIWTKPQAEKEDTPQETGAGGADLPVDDTLYGAAPDTSFAPYYISAPLYQPVEGRVSSPFGHRIHPITGAEGFHTGIDLACAQGTRIAAAWYGQVKAAAYDDTSGNYLVLDHGNGLQTVYCHCSELLASEGAWVRAGETIALVGETGAATGPHLHFEVRIHGVRHNPAWVLG